MSEHDRQELSPVLQALLASGRPGPDVPPGEKDALIASLGPLLGPSGGGPDGCAGDGAGSGPSEAANTFARAAAGSKVAFSVGGLVAGIAMGAAGHAALTEAPAAEPTPIVHVVASASATSPSAEATESAPTLTPSSLPVVGEEATPVRTPRRAVPNTSSTFTEASATELRAARDEALRKERQLLDIARTAVTRKDGAAALDALNQHASRFPKGRLAEEREALRVQALLLLGRKDEARESAETFRDEHPDSLMLPGVAPALQ